MRKLKSKILCTLVAAGMLAAVAVPSFAANTNMGSVTTPITSITGDTGMITRATPCGNCGKGTMQIVKTSYGAWHASGKTRKCTHYPEGLDAEETRKKTVTYKCTYCNSGYDRTSTESRWICHGFK